MSYLWSDTMLRSIKSNVTRLCLVVVIQTATSLLTACGGADNEAVISQIDQSTEIASKTTPAPAPAPAPAPGPQSGNCEFDDVDQEMLIAVNAARANARSCGSRGHFASAPALVLQCQLKNAAQGHSDDMATNNFFSHTSSNGLRLGNRVSNAGYNYSMTGENIAVGYNSVDAVMSGWLQSDGHCANLMTQSYTDFGLGLAAAGSRLYWTQNFGRPR